MHNYSRFKLILSLTILFVNASPQLDLPPQNDSFPIKKFLNENRKLINERNRIKTNGHSVKLPETSAEQLNENGVDANVQFGDPFNYDRDRSQRYGPPYSNDNDNHYYKNLNNYENRSASFYDQNRFNPDYDDEDKYYVQPRPHRPSPDPYYINERDRNRYSYTDYQRNYNGVCEIFICEKKNL